MTFRGKRFTAAVILLLLLDFVGASHVSAQDVNGSIVGIAKDSTGAVVSSAKVTVKNTGTSAQTSGVVLSDGSFTLKVSPGVYDVTVDAAGFKSVRILGIQC